MAKIQPVWALDIGQAALKALKLVPGDEPDTVLAEAFDYVEHPKILSQPDADPETLVREALATFMDRNDLKGCKVAIGVPGQAGLVKFIKLPPVEKKRIPDIVKFEAKQQIPFALEEVVWAYQQIGDDEEGGDDDFTMAEVGLFAMKRDQINRAILPFRAAGIEVDIVQMAPIALYNFIATDQLKGSDLKGSIVLLDIGADHTDLIITDGTRIWQRNVPIGGNHFTRALTKELKLTFAKAEHLKRNATKAPDPKAVFTAMRGVFNDFASEINRSIGFYSSINKTSKVVKAIGLGNGFKLPGLQKFLQQNLNGLDVERLDGFTKLVGDEVRSQPQFIENLPSFAVSYGLALQGLAASPLRTNLLPPEIEQVRLIRAKKPWVLAASALIMLGLSSLFLSDYAALAKVSTDDFKRAVDKAKATTGRGAGYKSAFDAAKGAWSAQYQQGTDLIVNDADRAKWPAFLQLINGYIPNPTERWDSPNHPGHLDPKVPADVPIIDKLRVHIDRIAPVYVNDTNAEWFANIPEQFKNLMHPYDRDNPPSGPGWIVQIVGHHYNPQPGAEEMKLPPSQRTAYGPRNYLQFVVLPALEKVGLRQKGVHHVALAGLLIDKSWISSQGAAGSGLAGGLPVLPRATGAPAAGDSASSGPLGVPGGQGGRPMMPGGTGRSPGMDPRTAMPGMGMPGMGMPGMGMPGMPGMPAASDQIAKLLVKQVRTDFLIQFIWQPPTADAKAEEPAEIATKLHEAESKAKGAVAVSDEALTSATEATAKKNLEAQAKAADAATKAAGPAAPPTPGAPAPAPRRPDRRAPVTARPAGPRPAPAGRRPGPGRPAGFLPITPRPRAYPIMANAKPASTADASEQLKRGLRWVVRNRFWLIVALSALLPVVGYALGAGPVQEETKKKVAEIKGADSGVAPYTQPGVPNDQWKPIVDAKTEVLTGDINKAWTRLYDVQAPLLKWPEVVESRFHEWGRKWPENVDLNAVQKAIDDYVNAYEAEVDQTYAKVNPWDYQTGKGVVVAPDKFTLLRPSVFDPANPPSLNKVWSAQEKLWIQGTLLDAVAKVNGKAKDWDSAVVKQVDLVDVGSPTAQDQKSLVEGKTVEPAQEIVPPGGTPTAAPDAAPATPGAPGGMEPRMGSGGGPMGANAVPEDVYRLKTDGTQYFIVPVSMTVLLDQNRLQEFLVGLENSPMAIQVLEFEMLKPSNPVTKPVQGEPAAGLGMSMGPGMGMPGDGRPRGMPMMPGMKPGGPMMPAVLGRPMPGPGIRDGASTTKHGTDVRGLDREKARKDREEKRKALGRAVDLYYDVVQVTVYGQARFYNPPPPPPPAAETSPGEPAPDAAKSEEKPGGPKADEASKSAEAKPAEPGAPAEARKDEAAPGAEPKPGEPAKSKAEPKAEPEPAKPEPAGAEPAKAEPKAEPAKAEPKAEPAGPDGKPADMPKS